MVTPDPSSRFALRSDAGVQTTPDGAWWPESRRLDNQLARLFALWPADRGRINRVLYSPLDWDDRPHRVRILDRWVKTGNRPREENHELTLSIAGGERRTISVIAPSTRPEVARALLELVTRTRRWAWADTEDPSGWENEGGHLGTSEPD